MTQSLNAMLFTLNGVEVLEIESEKESNLNTTEETDGNDKNESCIGGVSKHVFLSFSHILTGVVDCVTHFLDVDKMKHVF